MDALQRMPWILQDQVFKKLSEIAEVGSLSKEDREKYDESLRHYRDTLVVMEGQYLEGEKKGRAEGRAEERLLNARKLKENGVPIDIIAKSLSLTEKELADL